MTTYKRVNVHMNKHDADMLQELCEIIKDSQSSVLKNALLYYYIFITKKGSAK